MGCGAAGVVAHAGFNLWNLWMTGPHSVRPVPVSAGWGGLGGDAAVTAPAFGCARVGGRVSFVHQTQDESVGVDGRREHVVLSVPLGAESALPWGFQLGGYLQPGYRVTVVHDTIALPTLETEYRDTTGHPTLSALGVVRWWALPALGVHLAVQVPLVDLHRALNFADQHVALGLDARFGGGSTGAALRESGFAIAAPPPRCRAGRAGSFNKSQSPVRCSR
jgi:hypothetical protein